MWKDTRRTRTILNIFLVILILVILGGLAFVLLQLHAQTVEHDKELSEAYVQQQQQQAVARQETMAAVDAEYEKDLQTVAEYLPGIVCWGDSTTAAVSGMLNYPYVLQVYLNTYLCDIYDLSSSIENYMDYTRLDWDKYIVNVPVVNMAAGQESSYTIMGRAGVDPYVLSKDLVLPAEAEPVEVFFTSTEGKTVTPLTGGDAGVNNVRLGGIEGRLGLIKDEYYYYGPLRYSFTRLTPGSEVTIPAGTALKTASEDLYRDYIHVVMIGMYGEYTSADDLVQQVKTLLARQTKNSDRFIVLGPYSTRLYGHSYSQLAAIDTAMLQAFGNRYISIRKYLVGDGYIDAGKTPTKEDELYVNQEMVPPSFKASSNSEELNSLAHRLIGKLIYTRMDSLGYFDEVKAELNLTETTKQIIKDDPQYFESIIKNVLK
jgi:hypothetical protein